MAQIYNDRWQIVDNLSEGGQAHVFTVKDLKGGENTLYILKRLKNIQRLARFKREYDVIRGITHPNVIRVIDFDFDSLKPFFITEFCELGSLEAQTGLLTGAVSEKVNAFLEICNALQAVHKRGITHRDIKPANIFVRRDGTLALGDFGLSHDQADSVRLTAHREVVGSRHFTAPEYEDGPIDEVTQTGDIYSLGKVLYWLLSGGKVFSREKLRDPQFDLTKIVNTEEPVVGRLMEHFNVVLQEMITADPKDRASIEWIIRHVRRAERCWSLEYALPTTPKEELGLCRFCGQGDYVQCQDSPVNFGIEQKGKRTLKILICNWCGHVELFRTDLVNGDSPARE